ncbi:MAG: hypothetical protein AUJ72_04255 [Candidatus Omnitrophica bacterium CG1_02_46_14]|nr:MAG: hypothetical protein AUJ72_04255 [Candidatus Omnitrophica bacterium CG1_02_46_14]
MQFRTIAGSKKEVQMKKIIFWSVLAFILFVSPVFAAGSKQFLTSDSSVNYVQQDERALTPNQRIVESEKKVQANPGLRDRWNRLSRQPASEGSFVNDNLAQKILSNFREDEEISKLPIKLKVASSRGVITLSGVVNSADERALIEEKVSKMEGVKKVITKLKIKASDKDLLD